MDRDEPAITWLLHSEDPSIRYFALIDLLDESEDSQQAVKAKNQIIKGSRLQALLANQQPDGGFSVHPYRKWTGAHWRLVSMVELGVAKDNKLAARAAEHVLDWIAREKPPKVDGLWRAHASVKGNVLGVCSRLGLADDPRVRSLAQCLVEWQWPDGGWNCDNSKQARHSSFYESLATLWGLAEYWRATNDHDSKKAVGSASEFFLKHRLFRSCSNGKIINPQWLKLHYPLYWHYDILQALRILKLAKKLGDPRTSEALDVVESKRLKDGRWQPEGYYWHLDKRAESSREQQGAPSIEVVDWGRDGPNEMITLNALRILKGSRRIR